LDSGTTLGTASINESILVTQSQGGLAQGSYGGVGWLNLGQFTSTDGNLEVLLTNLATGKDVDADGALLVPVGGPMVVRKGNPVAISKVSIGVLDPSMTDSSSSSRSTSTTGQSVAPTISIGGVSPPSAVHVVYNQGPQSSGPQSAASLVDAVLGVIDGSAKALISGKKSKS
jgi:hypothetical protein